MLYNFLSTLFSLAVSVTMLSSNVQSTPVEKIPERVSRGPIPVVEKIIKPSELSNLDSSTIIEPLQEIQDTQQVINNQNISNIVPEPVIKDDSYYVLKSEYGFYKGSFDQTKITKIVFTDTAPMEYDEKWFANKSDTEDVIGYRSGTVVYIVGEKIIMNSYSPYLFAAKDRFGFDLWVSLESIEGLDYIDTSKLECAAHMFEGNMNIKELDLNSWDMSNVEDISFMFAKCLNLEKLYVDKWDVSNVEDFAAFLQGSSHQGDMKISYIDVSKWVTSSAKDMGHVFYGCGQLEYIDVSNWDVRNVKNFSHMFADCFALKTLDITKWKTLSVQSFDAFLNDCRSLVSIDISGLDTSTCTQFSQMFEACIALVEIIGIENLDVSNASKYSFSEMFHCCKSLRKLDLSLWDTSKADNFARMFGNCEKLETVNISGFKIDNLEYVTEMFYNDISLVEIIGIDELDFSGISDFDTMYNGTNIFFEV